MRHAGRVTDYRIAEAAELLGVSDDTVRRWVDAGRLPSRHRAAGRTVIPAVPTWPRCRVAGRPPGPRAHPRRRGQRPQPAAGIVTKVIKDTVMAQVEMVCGPYRMVSLMSAEAADELGLEPGVRAIASVKSTNVVVESARDQESRPRPRVALLAAARRVRCCRRTGGDGGDGSGDAARCSRASSLTDVFEELGARRSRPSTTASRSTFSFGSSTDLAEQAADGAPGDVLATADETSMTDRRGRRRDRRRRRRSPPTCW